MPKKGATSPTLIERASNRVFLTVPADVLAFLRSVKQATKALQKWESKSPHVASGHRKPKHFTPDGRMVGDIGEVLAERFFCLRLEKDQKAGYDGVLETDDETKVEIKITRKKAFQFRKITDRVIALSLGEDASEFEVIFNGPGQLLVDKAPGMNIAKRNGNHWHFDKPFNINPDRLRDLPEVDHKQRVPLREGLTPIFRP